MDLRIAPVTVQRQTVERLRAAILAGMFQPGERLVEAELQALLGISRPSLREALRSLEAERLITIIPNRGPYIPVVPWEEAEQIYRVRALLEGEAAARCAALRGEETAVALNGAVEMFAAAVREGNSAGCIEAAARFYEVLLDQCGNSIIRDTLRRLTARINFLRFRSLSQPGRMDQSMREMEQIAATIARGDAEAARQAAREHTRRACCAARQSYEDDLLD
ncbi:GntR family transcriptional regulator [Pseudochelatococcus sp. B33]